MADASGVVSLDADRAIVLSRVFDAPRDLVFDAWTHPDHIAEWWGPAGFENTRVDVDLSVGGAFRILMRAPDASVHECAGVFLEIVRPERLVYEGDAAAGDACGAGLPPKARVTVTFEELADGATRLTIDTRFLTPAARLAARAGGFTKGWLEGLERLAAVISERKA